jgi:hypothetical protein
VVVGPVVWDGAQPEAELLENPLNGTGPDDALGVRYSGLPLVCRGSLATPGPSPAGYTDPLTGLDRGVTAAAGGRDRPPGVAGVASR